MGLTRRKRAGKQMAYVDRTGHRLRRMASVNPLDDADAAEVRTRLVTMRYGGNRGRN